MVSKSKRQSKTTGSVSTGKIVASKKIGLKQISGLYRLSGSTKANKSSVVVGHSRSSWYGNSCSAG